MHRSFFSTTANDAVLRPMDVYTNTITPETHAQLKAKFTACNLVCTEGMPMTKFAPSLDSYESLGVNVGKTHRNGQGFKIFAAMLANCLRIAQISRYQKGYHSGRNFNEDGK